MQAFILAAGLGTRLRPITDSRPKALVEVGGKPLLGHVIERMTRSGARHIVVNVHHFADMVIDYLSSHSWGAEVVVSDERNMLLDTGGGLKYAEPLLLPSEPIVVHNVDILSRIDIAEMVRLHISRGNLATLAVSRRNTSRQLLFTHDGQLAGWHNDADGTALWVSDAVDDAVPLAFSGMAVVQPEMLDKLPAADHAYPIVPAYISLARENKISYYQHKPEDWLDVGKPQTLQKAQQWILS